MTLTLDIPEDLQERVDIIARRSGLSPSQVVSDALANGYSLEWQEHFLDTVAAGIEAADRGDFASDDEVARVFNKYRPA